MEIRCLHRLPPQPFEWFSTLTQCLDDTLTIRISRQEDRPIAGIMTLSFKNHVYYKYSGSDM